MNNSEPGFLRTLTSINTSKNYDKDVKPSYYEQTVKFKGRSRLGSYIAEKLTELLPAGEPQSKNVLDMGSGTGIISEELHKSGYRVTSADLSIKALDYLNEKRPYLDPVQLDMNQKLPFGDESFDGVTTVASNRYMNDTSKLLTEVFRVLKTEGVFLWPIFESENMISFKSLKMFKTFKPETLEKQLLLAGFKDIKIIKPSLTEVLKIVIRKFLQPEYIPILIEARK